MNRFGAAYVATVKGSGIVMLFVAGLVVGYILRSLR
jgi:hypothetical protein